MERPLALTDTEAPLAPAPAPPPGPPTQLRPPPTPLAEAPPPPPPPPGPPPQTVQTPTPPDITPPASTPPSPLSTLSPPPLDPWEFSGRCPQGPLLVPPIGPRLPCRLNPPRAVPVYGPWPLHSPRALGPARPETAAAAPAAPAPAPSASGAEPSGYGYSRPEVPQLPFLSVMTNASALPPPAAVGSGVSGSGGSGGSGSSENFVTPSDSWQLRRARELWRNAMLAGLARAASAVLSEFRAMQDELDESVQFVNILD